jgi:hypothetical protein
VATSSVAAYATASPASGSGSSATLPLTVQRPWREVGPVLVHAEPCAGYEPSRGLPEFVAGKPRVPRSYTADQRMYCQGNRLTGSDENVADVLDTLLADPNIREVHVRNVEAQCFIARVTR